MAYKVKEVIETDREGNRKQKEGTFNTYNQAVFHIKQRMKEIIKQDALKFFRMYGQKITTEKLNSFCNDELVSWLDESDGEQFPYVASCLEWSCFWIIEQKIPWRATVRAGETTQTRVVGIATQAPWYLNRLCILVVIYSYCNNQYRS